MFLYFCFHPIEFQETSGILKYFYFRPLSHFRFRLEKNLFTVSDELIRNLTLITPHIWKCNELPNACIFITCSRFRSRLLFDVRIVLFVRVVLFCSCYSNCSRCSHCTILVHARQICARFFDWRHTCQEKII